MCRGRSRRRRWVRCCCGCRCTGGSGIGDVIATSTTGRLVAGAPLVEGWRGERERPRGVMPRGLSLSCAVSRSPGVPLDDLPVLLVGDLLDPDTAVPVEDLVHDGVDVVLVREVGQRLVDLTLDVGAVCHLIAPF